MKRRFLAALMAMAGLCLTSNAHAAGDLPLAFDAKSVGGPNSGATMELWLPQGSGPFPAVIVMHGCDGVSSHQRSWAGRLVSWGYAAAIVDSFRPRRVNSTCLGGGNPRPQLRAQDAFNAATYLRTLPQIAPDRIGIIGFSHGGTSTLYTTLASEVPAARGGRPFAVAVAYYPTCKDIPPTPTATDVLILAARDDDWTPAAPCVKLVAARAGQPHAPTIKVYPVVHGFDLPGTPQLYAGHMSGGNPEVAADSFIMSKAFLDAKLR
jgi:dienelactone hydrolase